MDVRQLKALEIAARMRITFKDGAWIVPSQSGKGSYCVVLAKDSAPTCTCPDFELTGKECKHIYATIFVVERDCGGQQLLIDPTPPPERKTYKQDWPAYNLAQTTEKRRLQSLLAELCAGLPEPERAKQRGRRPHLVSDSIFAMTFKVYSTFSSRRFHCDLAEAHERGHLANPIPGLKVNSFFENPEFTPILQRLIGQSSLPLRAVETVFAPDSTGFTTSRFYRWYDHKYGAPRQEHDWVKAHAICGVKTNVVTAVEIHGRDSGDSPQFKPLVEATAANGFTVKEVPADKAYLSHENLAVVDSLGGTSFVPFKTNSVQGEAYTLWEKMYFFYQFRREEFLKHYHQRSNIESTFSMVKAKFRDHVRSKTDVAMKNEVLCKFLCHNICCVIQSQCELGIEATFWPEKEEGQRDVLPLVRGR